MDSCVRCLREGRTAAGRASLVLLVDEVEGCIGGDAVFDQLLLEMGKAICEGRAQAQQLHAVALDRPPSELEALGVTSVTDLFTDPCGWVQQQQQPGSQANCSNSGTANTAGEGSSSSSSGGHVQWRDLQALQGLCQAGLQGLLGAANSGGSNGSSSGGFCLVVAGLSTLLQRHSSMQVLQVLQQLQASSHVSSMLLSVHQDLHTLQVLAALQTMSTAVLQLQLVQGLQQQLITQATGKPCHGQLTSSIKRSKLGRLRVDQQCFTLLVQGGVEVYAVPQGVVMDARALVDTGLHNQVQQQATQQGGRGPAAAAVSSGGAPEPEVHLATKVSNSMRLDISEQERAAKAAVQLPYVHQGAGKAYETGDARHYLPPAAGGIGPGVDTAAGNKLGHILYVRDSDEEHDSDEDPDDDLDV